MGGMELPEKKRPGGLPGHNLNIGTGCLRRNPFHQWQLKHLEVKFACTLIIPFECREGLVIVVPCPPEPDASG